MSKALILLKIESCMPMFFPEVHLETILTIKEITSIYSLNLYPKHHNQIADPYSLFLCRGIYFNFSLWKISNTQNRNNNIMKSHVPHAQCQQLRIYGQSCFISVFYFLTIGLFWDKSKTSFRFIYAYFSMYISK